MVAEKLSMAYVLAVYQFERSNQPRTTKAFERQRSIRLTMHKPPPFSIIQRLVILRCSICQLVEMLLNWNSVLHLAAAAVIGRAYHISRKEGQNRSGSHRGSAPASFALAGDNESVSATIAAAIPSTKILVQESNLLKPSFQMPGLLLGILILLIMKDHGPLSCNPSWKVALAAGNKLGLEISLESLRLFLQLVPNRKRKLVA
ncbi:hypothetical protein ZIOFF_024605 [Zingiber officinale]|uniref:Uncharacterized protein n=1 Tax=Zingiber officinale TaxID=94328 RepID=A0A8J5GYI2_ZINOF|nr:hypothetical protein ZIOFF_024605 [Zingiber officinale]